MRPNTQTLQLLLSGFVSLLLTALMMPKIFAPGILVAPDSVMYLNAASNLLSGNGLSNGCAPILQPMTHWAPLYSLVLAPGLLLGVDWLPLAKGLNLIWYFLLLLTSARVTYRFTGSLMVALSAELALGVHPVLLFWSGGLLTEPLSWVVLVLIIIFGIGLVQNPTPKTALLFGLVLGFSSLLRYAFLGFAAGGALLFVILLGRVPIKRVFSLAGITLLTLAAILGAWLLRNYILTGALAETFGGEGSLLENAYNAALVGWSLFTGVNPPSGPVSIVIIFLPLFFTLEAVRFFKGLRQQSKGFAPAVLYLVSFALAAGYFASIVFLRTYRDPVTLEHRIFSPLIIPMVFMFGALLTRKPLQDAGLLNYQYLLRVVIGTWLILLAFTTYRLYPEIVNRNLLYYDLADSPALDYAVANYQPEEMMVTEWEPFWLWNKVCPPVMPLEFNSPSPFSGTFPSQAKAYIWLSPTLNPTTFQPSDLPDGDYQDLDYPDGLIKVVE